MKLHYHAICEFLTAVILKNVILWDGTFLCAVFNSENGGNMFLRNHSNPIPDYM
jgi:hypothetical protein